MNYREFLDTFDSGAKDGKVTADEWVDYYRNVSASIDDDDYFELMMRNAWHISGGEGWCANSSCRRVLATHADGHQSVEEIKVSDDYHLDIVYRDIVYLAGGIHF
jgi:DNA-directed RNA polymerase subunit N (RpoN/RPB10)